MNGIPNGVSVATMERDPKFYNEIKQANEDLLSYIQENQEKGAYFDYTNTFRSYTKLIEDLKQQYPPIQANSLSWAQPTSENRPLFSLTHSQPQQNSTLDETNKTINVTSVGDETAAEDTAADQNGDDAPPPETNLDKYEEAGARFQCRAKLYERTIADASSKTLTYVGCGELFVKDLESPGKLHLIMRQDPDLRKVLINQTITKYIPLAQQPRAVAITGLEDDGVKKTYVLRVKDDKIAGELYNLLNSPKQTAD